MFKLFRKKSSDSTRLITAQTVLIVGDDVYTVGDIVKISTDDGKTYIGTVEKVVDDEVFEERFINLDISEKFNSHFKRIYIEDIKSVEAYDHEGENA
jgi:hypothetical protein